tara:strand:- start:37 stop:519 length:483 start_codon:yes stop_codon:yes gene_type:complete
MAFIFDVRKISEGVYSAKIVDIEDAIAEAVNQMAAEENILLAKIGQMNMNEVGYAGREIGTLYDKKVKQRLKNLKMKDKIINEFIEKYCCKEHHIKWEEKVDEGKKGGEEGKKDVGAERGEGVEDDYDDRRFDGGRRRKKKKKTKKRKHKRKKKTRRRKK